MIEVGVVKATSRSGLRTIAVAFVTVLVLRSCTGSPTTTALAVRVTSVGVPFPGSLPTTARDIAKVAKATACNSWVPASTSAPASTSYSSTELLVKVLVNTNNVAKVEADLSRLHAVRSVTEIARSQFDQAPAPDPGSFVPEPCT